MKELWQMWVRTDANGWACVGFSDCSHSKARETVEDYLVRAGLVAVADGVRKSAADYDVRLVRVQTID